MAVKRTIPSHCVHCGKPVATQQGSQILWSPCHCQWDGSRPPAPPRFLPADSVIIEDTSTKIDPCVECSTYDLSGCAYYIQTGHCPKTPFTPTQEDLDLIDETE